MTIVKEFESGELVMISNILFDKVESMEKKLERLKKKGEWENRREIAILECDIAQLSALLKKVVAF